MNRFARSTALAGQKSYRLLAANKTSTLEKEMQLAAETGFEYKGQTVFESAFGGREVSVIMERDKSVSAKGGPSYRLVATSKTSTSKLEILYGKSTGRSPSFASMPTSATGVARGLVSSRSTVKYRGVTPSPHP